MLPLYDFYKMTLLFFYLYRKPKSIDYEKEIKKSVG